jgi:ribonuclease HII
MRYNEAMQTPDLLTCETALWQSAHTRIAGVDEVGRGPLAGPVVAAAVVLPPWKHIPDQLAQLTDSKQLSEKVRQALFPHIQSLALDYSLGVVTADVIDRINILNATYLAMERALSGLERVDYVLVDGNRPLPWWQGPQAALVKGDSRSLSIAAASVLAKVFRDQLMTALDRHYPGYGLAQHKGYPTARHRLSLQQLGLSPQHRLTFCRKLLLEVA